MTESEAIKKHIGECNQRIENISFFMDSNSDANKEECCNNIEILQKVINALEKQMPKLEKQMPKKPIFDYNLSDTLTKFHCECGNTIKVNHDVGIMDNNNAPNYCSECGCRLDWSDSD